MPDPTKRTVSASQVAALFGKSPYETRWMLYHRFKGTLPETAEDNRMDWGKLMQPLLLEAAAQDLRLEVTALDPDFAEVDEIFDGQVYVRCGNLGCTKDAIVICPDRGPGALELKVCFDYRVWMTRWSGGEAPPEDIELQLQCQMAVGDGEKPYEWGIVAVWLAGEMHYFERERVEALTVEMQKAAHDFLVEIEEGNEPEPAGEPIELPALAAAYPRPTVEERDLSADPAAVDAVEAGRMLEHAWAERKFWQNVEKRMKARLLGLAADAGRVLLPGGARVEVKRSQVAGGTYERKPGVRTNLKFWAPDGDLPVPDDAMIFG